MTIYKNMKTKACSLDSVTIFFDIAREIWYGDTSAPYLFIIFLDYIKWTPVELMKENGFILKKEKRQPINCRNDEWFGQRRWSSSSRKYTNLSGIPVAQPWASSKGYRFLRELR